MKRSNVQTFQLGLTGYPLGHSLSPKIHKAALDACGLKGDYSLFPVSPDDLDGLNALLACLRRGELHGLNVTIPHKQAVIPLLDELTPTAEAIGAINTIFTQNGQLIGDNTDAPGFLVDLKRFLTTETQGHGDKKSVLVLGAGGSARAIVYALVSDGWEVMVAARRLEQAEGLARRYAQNVSVLDFLHLSSFILHPSPLCIINTTPLGMSPHTDASPWPAGLPLPQNAAVYDLVYNPRETKLVRMARAAGLPAVTGLGMLVEQAALAFEIWTGHVPPREALTAAIN